MRPPWKHSVKSIPGILKWLQLFFALKNRSEGHRFVWNLEFEIWNFQTSCVFLGSGLAGLCPLQKIQWQEPNSDDNPESKLSQGPGPDDSPELKLSQGPGPDDSPELKLLQGPGSDDSPESKLSQGPGPDDSPELKLSQGPGSDDWFNFAQYLE